MGVGEIWKSIETLYLILPPSIFDEVEKDHDKIVKLLNNANNGSTVDFIAMVESNSECYLILEQNAFSFFRRMYYLLYKGNYLEKGEMKPRYSKDRKLSGLP